MTERKHDTRAAMDEFAECRKDRERLDWLENAMTANFLVVAEAVEEEEVG